MGPARVERSSRAGFFGSAASFSSFGTARRLCLRLQWNDAALVARSSPGRRAWRPRMPRASPLPSSGASVAGLADFLSLTFPSDLYQISLVGTCRNEGARQLQGEERWVCL